MDPIGLAMSLHRALEAGESGSALRRFFTADAVTVEHPNLVKPPGARSSAEEMIANSEKGAELLSSQKYDVHSAVVSGSTAILRPTWTGVLRDGRQLVAHIAQFVDTRDGLISAIETFDCYEPF
ncbi:nuclear transport factor 2 family protein [Lentzea sp. NEAU-D7]|uniref:nuclear transport factor 2 family protein n=1 Tax=Lentzea sp. NEAU-D7 TaxID=2994667 RepID=UPI00224B7824|nr:nuclear transport factor 2 family protein [Lentzea sp. NEAU-D7]MCX2949733.1 nuclear transport factor 2 family protein [Lentzea sp. NEAU-D7]